MTTETANSPADERPTLVLGASGLAGKAIVSAAQQRGRRIVTASRQDSDYSIDVENVRHMISLIEQVNPSAVINSVADINLKRCEENPGQTWCVNARPAAILADLSRLMGFRLIHISTDHYFSGDGPARHDENAPVTLLNEYARTKYAAESLALTAPNCAILRTNIVGLHPTRETGFARWALNVVRNDAEAVLFDDQYVSSIDIWSFAECVWDICATGFCGIVNVGSRDVFSKADFVLSLATQEGKTLTRAKIGSVGIQDVRRPDSLGLDTARVETLLTRQMPSLNDVITAIRDRA